MDIFLRISYVVIIISVFIWLVIDEMKYPVVVDVGDIPEEDKAGFLVKGNKGDKEDNMAPLAEESSGMGYRREKYWKELNTEEKVERMRQEVKTLQERYDKMYVKLDRLECLFQNHNHVDGNVMADVKKRWVEQYKRVHSCEEEQRGEVRF